DSRRARAMPLEQALSTFAPHLSSAPNDAEEFAQSRPNRRIRDGGRDGDGGILGRSRYRRYVRDPAVDRGELTRW
ncbi:MAG: hypothetical protein ACR2H3_15800, partial [Acidimicrobiales bacterium]